ncbi:flagellar basal-body rod protein FlgF [Aquabacter cavernae]|uniref:flagellar basal-body rod protein FlgF n=1 Tax=Aquabacter cavernae TaxID=2496029 RepID=UPI000F8CCC17|nr:flagellar basal-body rod protein FlgF [Aquabacter cavernae]
MSAPVYLALSAQMTMERRLATIATNLSNMSTPGYRAEEVKFESMVERLGKDGVAFPQEGEVFTSLKAGPLTYTGNPLDVAVRGDVWLGIATPEGRVLTRDGRLQITANGDLQSIDGFPVLDPGGTPIMLDPEAGQVHIGADGSLTQNGAIVGTIGLFEMAPGPSPLRYSNSGIIPMAPVNTVVDFTHRGVRQGYVEGANVNPILEMTKLIMVQRAFESAAMAVNQGEDLIQEAITSLGPSS